MNEKSKNILIVVLICIIFILSFALAFTLGMKYVEKNETKFDKNKEEVEQVADEIKVVDYINKSLDKNTIDKGILEKYTVCGEPATQKELGTVEVKLPMLDSTKTGAQVFNKMLQEKYSDQIEMLNPSSDVYKQLDPSDSKKAAGIFGSSSINYEYYSSDNYISIIINSSTGILCGSGGGSEFSYVYDIENDKYLTNENVLKKFNITKEQVKNKFIEKTPDLVNDEYLETTLNDSFEDLYHLYIEDGTLNISYNKAFDPFERPIIQISIN